MKLISVNVGEPRAVVWKGKTVTTGIFKEPVSGRVRLRALNLEGDRQADLSVHGGPDKAVYAYPAEHYAYWREELKGRELPWGMFGENFTTEGLLEDQVQVGDQFQIGSASVRAVQPRLPCYKLAVKFGRDDVIKRFLDSGRTGFYFSVIEEGEVGAGDAIERLSRDEPAIMIADLTRLYARDRDDVEMLRRALRVAALPESWRAYFAQRLEQLA